MIAGLPPTPFVLSEVEAHASRAAPGGTSFDFAQDERRLIIARMPL
jgi:hypothetical protein